MPQFAPGEAKTAIAPITVKPAGLSCEAEVFLGPNEATKVATSGRIPFVSTGLSQDVHLPIAMPAAEGTYHVYVDVYAEDYLIAAYQAIEDVVIALPMANLYGVVTDAITGYPLPGVLVTLNGLEVYTNAAGNYSFEGVETGEYLLQFSKEGYETAVY
ncbi:hypothetical protein ES705_34770 [subsurface metagenome]|jgi:hypothetical protein